MMQKQSRALIACQLGIGAILMMTAFLITLGSTEAQIAEPPNSTLVFVACIEDKNLGLIISSTSVPTGTAIGVNIGDSCVQALNDLQRSGFDVGDPIALVKTVFFFMRSPPICGNQIIEGNEVCDSEKLRSQTCVTLGFESGDLACESNCTSLDTQGCVAAAPMCQGNETLCIDLCVDLAVNVFNCGACGNECTGGTPFCNAGACVAAP